MKNSNPFPGWMGTLFAFLLSNLTVAQVVFVDHAAAGANDGTSWVNAFANFSDALSAAKFGDQIWIADGVYKPTVTYDFNADGIEAAREASFLIPDGVVVYGGFEGGELTLDERDWETARCILSGDIDNNDLNSDGNFIAEAVEHIVGDNAYHVVATNDVGAPTGVDGVIITAGLARETDFLSANATGGGWYNLRRSLLVADGPSVTNSIFQGNSAVRGGAIGSDYHSVDAVFRISHCTFTANKAHNGGAIATGGLQCDWRISDCRFLRNRVTAHGGALTLYGDVSTITACLFSGNTAGMEPENLDANIRVCAGAVDIAGSTATFTACTFENNVARSGIFDRDPIEGGGGGAIGIVQGERGRPGANKFIGCGFYNNETYRQETAGRRSWGGAVLVFTRNGITRPQFTNCVFAGNRSGGTGGAIAAYLEHLGPFDPTPAMNVNLTNCTFVANHADEQGGAIYNNEFRTGATVLNTRVENCILWNNSAGVEGNEIFNNGGLNSTFVAFSIVQGSGGSGAAWDVALGEDGGNNLAGDPGFFDVSNPYGADATPATDDDGLQISSPSPAINAGNNGAAALATIGTDYRGNLRIIFSRVDCGAYEQGIILPPHTLRPWTGCAACPWAFTTLPFEPSFVWDGDGMMTTTDGGKATIISGKIVSTTNKSLTFDVYLKLVNVADWTAWSKAGRSYITYTPEAAAMAKQSIGSWRFWELSPESYLKGTGSATGVLALQHYPKNVKAGWQFGGGANGWDKDVGVGGLFTYSGTLVIKNKKQKLSGLGSMNVDGNACLKCIPVQPNQLVADEINELTEAEGKSDLIVFPTVADRQITIASETLAVDTYMVTLHDQHGVVRRTQFVDTGQGDAVLLLDNLQSGPYVVRLVSSGGVVHTRKIMVK